MEAHAQQSGADPDQMRTQIARLDREASLLRNRSQITPKTRARMAQLSRESASLATSLPDRQSQPAHQQAQSEQDRARFARGHRIYRETQAPALIHARIALTSLTDCALPPHLARQLGQTIADLDEYAHRMEHFCPSQPLPKAMQRLLYLTNI